MAASNLYQRNGTWYARVQINGCDLRKSLRTKLKAMAKQRLREFLKDAETSPRDRISDRDDDDDLIAEIVARKGRGPGRNNHVYFVQAASGGPIKIGRTLNPKRRLQSMRLVAPQKLIVLACVPTAPEVEETLHEKFAKERLHGEWFRPTARLKRFIAAIGARQAESEPAHSTSQGATVRRKNSPLELIEAAKYISNFKW